MENVVYLLGAGFSAPLGLPVMSNFLVKSKDIYFQNPEKYKHFQDVFKLINEMSITKNYYDADLFNIEEILSILEMREELAGERDKRTFLEYITNVIEYFTPALKQPEGLFADGWDSTLFERDFDQLNYGYFAASLRNSCFFERTDPSTSVRFYSFIYNPEPDVKYSVL